jgi:uncharacterized membrane protein
MMEGTPRMDPESDPVPSGTTAAGSRETRRDRPAMPGGRALRKEEQNVPPYLQGLVSRTLRTGVVAAGALLLTGTLLLAILPGASGWGATALSATTFAQNLLHLEPAAFLLLGVLVLILTPLTRVVISVVLFSAAGDRPFSTLTLVVLLILGLSVFLGLHP